MFLSLGQGFLNVLNLNSIFMISVGVFAGITIGAIPGLTATMSIAVITPLTFGLPPTVGIVLLLGVYVGGIYGGSITAILLRTPGTPASIATTFDGYPLSKQGKAGQALYLALVSSVIGGVISSIILITIAPQIAKVALKFGPRRDVRSDCIRYERHRNCFREKSHKRIASRTIRSASFHSWPGSHYGCPTLYIWIHFFDAGISSDSCAYRLFRVTGDFQLNYEV